MATRDKLPKQTDDKPDKGGLKKIPGQFTAAPGTISGFVFAENEQPLKGDLLVYAEWPLQFSKEKSGPEATKLGKEPRKQTGGGWGRTYSVKVSPGLSITIKAVSADGKFSGESEEMVKLGKHDKEGKTGVNLSLDS